MHKTSILGISAAALLSGPAAAQDRWETAGTVYLWFPAAIQELITDREIKLDRADLVENLEFGLMGEITARRGDWLVGGEVFYTAVSKDDALDFTIQSGSPDLDDIRVVGDVAATTTMLQGFAGYKLLDDAQGRVYGTAGLRYASFDTEIDVSTDNAAFQLDDTITLLDATVGLRGRANLAENWSLPFIVDVGAGTSQFTFNMFAGLSYDFGQNSVTVGYRKLEWLLNEDDEDLLKRIQFNGPLVAYTRRF